MSKICWVLSLFFGAGAALQLAITVSTAGSAPQQAAGAALAAAMAVVPYCFARSVDELTKE
jgi:hypothetical protein